MSQISPNTPRNFSPVMQPDSQDIPETQPVQKKRANSKGKKKVGEPSAPKKTNTPWSMEEKIALCRAWIEVSEDRLCGINFFFVNFIYINFLVNFIFIIFFCLYIFVADYPKRRVFWNKIREKFYATVGSEARNPDMISG